MTKVRWGILATGNIAKTFARGVQASSTGELVAVGSRTQAGADKFGAEFNIPRRHASYEALLADKDVDAVYIATPHPGHAEWAIKAAEAGKHILVEKPITLNHAGTMAVIEAARRNDVFLMEGFMYRCHPQIAKLVELIKSGAIGQVRMIQATFSFNFTYNGNSHRLVDNALGGGGILDVGCYPMSFARLVAGAAIGKDMDEPVEVKAVGKLQPTQRTDEYTAAVVSFGSGVIAQISTGIQVNQDNSARVYGSTGWIHLTDPWIPSRDGSSSEIIVHTGDKSETITVEPGRPLYALEADTVAANLARRQAAAPAMSWADSLGNMRALDMWRQSIGLVYDEETADAPAMKLPISRQPLKLRAPRPGEPTMIYGRVPGVEKPMSRLIMGVDNQASIAHASVMFDDFYERGGNVFDTAFIYMGGLSEKLLGQWVRNRGLRENVVIVDKGAHTPHCNPEQLAKQFAVSLERLGMDYVDIYMMHRDNPDIPVAEFVDVLNEQKAAGRMRVFGGSNWSVERVQAANAYAKSKNLTGFGVLSNNFSLARLVEPMWAGCIAASDPKTRAWLTETQMPLLPWSSQARGFFLDNTAPDWKGDEERVRCWYADDNFERLKRARELAKKYGVTALNIALAYVLRQPFPTFPLIGPRQLSETRTSMPGVGIELAPDEVKWLNLEA